MAINIVLINKDISAIWVSFSWVDDFNISIIPAPATIAKSSDNNTIPNAIRMFFLLFKVINSV